MAEEIGAWLAEHELDKIDGLLDELLAHCEEFSDLKEMEEEDVAKLVTGLGLKTMKAKKVARAFAGLGGRARGGGHFILGFPTHAHPPTHLVQFWVPPFKIL